MARVHDYVFRGATGLLLLTACTAPCQTAARLQHPQEQSGVSVSLFDPNPDHAWNRLHRCLLARTTAEGKEYGEEDLDPLLWQETRHLLSGASHRQALGCLDDFLRTHAERQVDASVKQAILLRDLWAVFDWSVGYEGRDEPQRRELQVRLAEVLRRLAPTPSQVTALPDNYAQAIAGKVFAADYDPTNPQRPFLPPDLLNPRGPWVCITLRGYGPVARQHVGEFGARSRFLVFLRLPGGRAATLAYLRTLWSSPQPLVVNDHLNQKAPQFPAGTMVALARQMNLFDSKGKLIATPITESLQIRVYHAVTLGSAFTNAEDGPSSSDQDFFEFRLDRGAVFAGKPGLLAITPEQKEFPVFSTHGEDPFEAPSRASQVQILNRCRACHSDSGIHSVQSRDQMVRMREHAAQDVVDDLHYGPAYWETEDTLNAKRGRYDWGLLNGYWKGRQQ